jgi:hypothetical protein
MLGLVQPGHVGVVRGAHAVPVGEAVVGIVVGRGQLVPPIEDRVDVVRDERGHLLARHLGAGIVEPGAVVTDAALDDVVVPEAVDRAGVGRALRHVPEPVARLGFLRARSVDPPLGRCLGGGDADLGRGHGSGGADGQGDAPAACRSGRCCGWQGVLTPRVRSDHEGGAPARSRSSTVLAPLANASRRGGSQSGVGDRPPSTAPVPTNEGGDGGGRPRPCAGGATCGTR